MNAENSVLEYFKYKNIQTLDYLKFGYFKRIIGYILNCESEYYIRKLFLTLVEKNYFLKKKNLKQSYLYKFNPEGRPPVPITYPPDFFIVSWD
tara:strand:+ start:410 stop:688 length:279 start_codon:yes stop_codon:yes gene_type:complete